MKKIINSVTLLLVILLLVSCQATDNKNTEDKKNSSEVNEEQLTENSNGEENLADEDSSKDSVVPYKMQPGSVLVFDENCKPSVEKGGYDTSAESDSSDKADEIKVYPNMKIVYNPENGNIMSILYKNENKRSGYSIYNSEDLNSDNANPIMPLIPSKMEPGSVLLFDENCNPSLEKGGYIVNDESDYDKRPDDIEVYPNMKVVYNPQSGDIDNILYKNEKEPSGYSINNPEW